MMQIVADVIFAWLAINAALLVLLPRDEALRLSRNTIKRFKRAIGTR